MNPPATFTRIRLNPHHPVVRRDLADPAALHRTLMRLVPDGLGPHPRQQAGLLFRLETAPGQPPVLLVQTHQPPQLTHLPATYGTAETRDLAPMFHALTPGRHVRYRITANASTRPPSTGARGKVIALRGDAALAWWHRRATGAGLAPRTADAAPRPFRRPTRHSPYHALTQFEGTATITDPDTLIHALRTGIGQGKSYGAGLLTLAPA
ncbi:type I-E CRISPR-associated protein Cas6/Cse3/CasE [Actinacidiphila oryziradicis]|uniref:Type I-E CRISPR-associated protein Cas6/Cse3/CasE n=1 Tax=Actinacidiphila oryziradicis TaxID=2571141 RepID=A0A4U0RTV1_9ACTN|nr:type I-E CRISPR-associated protein Cas6/Cse3/CasE [Actinacidiphila oryziradicis]TJZ99593.1 type I-E CRISPR-associated protein Cas6/Cse3/CasE [Actinacidiphila oryziradicis]